MLAQGVPDSLDLVPIAAFEGKGKRKGCCLIVTVLVVIFLSLFSRTGSKYFLSYACTGQSTKNIRARLLLKL